MFNPAKRCTAEEALDHDFLKPVRRKDMEVSFNALSDDVCLFLLLSSHMTCVRDHLPHQKCASQPLESPGFLEKSKVDLSIVKEEVYKEVLWYKSSHRN